MFYYINILLICIALFLLVKQMTIKEGHINEISIPDGGIPNVPHDVVCLILYSEGAKVDRMEYLSNLCKSPKKNSDDSNICRT